MASNVREAISDGRGALVDPFSLSHLVAGTMVARDLSAARAFYEEFFGFEAVALGEDGLLLRDRRAKYLMEHGARDFFVLEVRAVTDIEKPQRMLNHWGVSVGSRDEVLRIFDVAKAWRDAGRLKKVRPITTLHESYGFYFIDLDDNWWEVEHRGGDTNDGIFSRGDFDNRTTDEACIADPSLLISETRPAVVGPEAFLTHGTVDVVQVVTARLFYEEVLGLRSVLRFPVAQFTAGGGDFAFVGVEVGDKHVADQSPDNRWVLLVDGAEALSERHDAAVSLRDKFGIRTITEPAADDRGDLSFLVESADSNWFEVSTRSRSIYIEKFARA